MVHQKRTLIKNKYELVAGIVLAILFSALFCLSGAPWQTAAGYAAAFLALGCIPPALKGKWRGMIAVLFALAAAVLAVWLMQTMLSADFKFVRPACLPLGFVIAEALILLLILITGRFSVGVGVGMGLMLLLSTVDSYVLQFRGTEFQPYDILAAGTAMHVASGYDFTPSVPLVTAWAQMALFVFAAAKLRVGKLEKRMRLRACLPLTALCVLASAIGLRNVVPEYFTRSGSLYNGVLVNYVAQVRDSFPAVPDHYDVQALEADAAQVKAYGRMAGPTIVVIMNESFADLRPAGPKLKTSDDVMPFFDSLKENTIRGRALVSVYGGGTANSEYEFLTGNATCFFPRGSVPYAQYVKENTYSLVSELHDRGYVCEAFHPYYSSCWQRKTVYPKLGFDASHFIEAFPAQNLLRGFISDQEMYETMIDTYEQRDASKPLFLFGVTVQNHGGYSYDGEDFQSEIDIRGLSTEYPYAEQFLTLIRKSDDALSYLIDYFSSVEDDVVVLFFGDHFPTLSVEFYEEIHGGAFDLEDLDEWEEQFQVPFVVWANYDIPEQEVGLTGLGYLSSYLYQAARIRPSAYSVMLSEIAQTIPALNGYGYYSAASGKFLPFEEAQGEDLEALNRYRQLQYNNTFDRQNRLPVF